MPSPKRDQRKRAPSPSRKRPRLRLTSCARGEASWRTLVDRFESEQRSLHDALSRRDAKILDLEAEIAAEKRYSDRLRQERKDSPPLSMGTASVTTAIEICHIHPQLSPSLSVRQSEVSIVIDSAVIHTSAFISIALIIVIPSPQDLRAKIESWQHAAESIEKERQTFKDKETVFAMQINDLKAELRDARHKSKAVKVSTTWEIQKLIEKQMLSQKKVYKDTIRLCPG